MVEGLHELYALQQVDTAIGRTQRALRALDEDTAAARALASVQSELASREGELRKLQADYQDCELQLKGVEKKRTDARYRLYGGRIHNPKELEALEKEVELQGTQIDGLETQMLELMERMEPLEREVSDLRSRVQQAAAKHQEVQAEHEQQRRVLQGQLAGLRQQREAAARAVPPSLLSTYDRVRQRVGVVGMSRVAGSTCDACHMVLPTVTLRELRESPSVRTCEGCGRILYLPE